MTGQVTIFPNYNITLGF